VRRIVPVVGILILSLLAVACGASTNNGEDLQGKTWHLGAASDTDPVFTVAVPAEQQTLYTITFNSDNTFNALADCNQTSGAWQTPRRSGLTITPGASTMAYCGPESYGDLYVHMLSRADTYEVKNDQLTINLTRGGKLTFVVGGTAAAPSAEATQAAATDKPTEKPTKEPTASPKPTKEPTATPKPTKEPTASPKPTKEPTPKPSKSPSPKPTKSPSPKPTTAPTPAPSNGLLGKTWQMSAIVLSDPDLDVEIPAEDQASYTVTFKKDGTFTAQADCNTINGTYTTADPTTSSGTLTLTPGPTTTVACPDGSLGDLFAIGLSRIESYSITKNVLSTVLPSDGSLTFK
jgi:heat shock protein HslJ